MDLKLMKQLHAIFTIFTRSGLRKKYEKTFGLNLKIVNNDIPLEPNATFLGIRLYPKLDFKEHLKVLNRK